jgi:hypothetical protein
MSNGSGRNLASVKSITFNSPHLAMYQDTWDGFEGMPLLSSITFSYGTDMSNMKWRWSDKGAFSGCASVGKIYNNGNSNSKDVLAKLKKDVCHGTQLNSWIAA